MVDLVRVEGIGSKCIFARQQRKAVLRKEAKQQPFPAAVRAIATDRVFRSIGFAGERHSATMAASCKWHTSPLLLLHHDDGIILTSFLCAIHPACRSFRTLGSNTPRRPVAKVVHLSSKARRAGTEVARR